MAQAPTDQELIDLADAARKSSKKLRNVAREATKDIARFQEAYEARLAALGIDYVVEGEDNHSPDGA